MKKPRAKMPIPKKSSAFKGPLSAEIHTLSDAALIITEKAACIMNTYEKPIQ